MTTAEYYHTRRNALLVCLGNECKMCGSEYALEFHHESLDDRGRSHNIGGWQQLYRLEREIAEGHDIQLLCSECHHKIHAGVKI